MTGIFYVLFTWLEPATIQSRSSTQTTELSMFPIQTVCGLILHNTDVFSLFVWGVCCGVPAVQPLRMVPGSHCRSEQGVLSGAFNASALYIASLKGNCGVPAVQPLRMVPGSHCRSEQGVLSGAFNASALYYIASLKGNCGVPAVQPWPLRLGPSSNCRSEQGVFGGIFSTSILYIASLKGNQMEQTSWALLTGTEWKIHPAVFHFISCPVC